MDEKIGILKTGVATFTVPQGGTVKVAQKNSPFYIMKTKNKQMHIAAILFFILSIYVFSANLKIFLIKGNLGYTKAAEMISGEINIKKRDLPRQIAHIKTPEQVKGIYISSWVAGTKDWRDDLIKFVSGSELNSVIIDVKDYSGKISFKPLDQNLLAMNSYENRIPDIDELIKKLHNENIYVIARISVFQDGFLAQSNPRLAVKSKKGGIWKDNKAVAWLDPANPEVWDYVIKISKEAEKRGFDEVNFDYIRFPSDGKLENMKFDFWDGKTTKSEVIKSFFVYLNENLKDTKIPKSADLFGLTTWRSDDMNIGQVLENAIPYFDYVSPMVYPSHYPPGFDGWKNPAEHPYEIILTSLNKGAQRLVAAGFSPLKIRPWLQDFDMGAVYDALMIKKQKQAVYDAGLNSFLIWDPSNKYTRAAYYAKK